ncbi:MAG: beta-eliminating lyase-related protein [Eubacteriales bacterium]|nr:beta-eliminating lyase-related protein [Eubacteriales bacterium]
MLYFECDYNNGCHPEILKKLAETNDIYQPGYGYDCFSLSAKEKIRKTFACPDADIFFLCGGTQTNAVVISSMLRDYQGVVAAETGHIGTHESGAIEYTGHKVLPLPQHDGKIDAAELKSYVSAYYADGNYDHMVFPGMVYISFPTELGTLYSKAELQAIHAVCSEYGMPLFIDGARLGYGLMSSECDIPVEEFAELCDVFYIGGTKVGALCGEAVVFPRGNAPEHFFSMVKQHGALFAKGRVCGVQFDTLFTDDLYFNISRNAISKAESLKKILKEKEYPFFFETPTNQQFVIAENSELEKLREKVSFGFWDKYDDSHTVIRFCTSWVTSDDDLLRLEETL